MAGQALDGKEKRSPADGLAPEHARQIGFLAAYPWRVGKSLTIKLQVFGGSGHPSPAGRFMNVVRLPSAAGFEAGTALSDVVSFTALPAQDVPAADWELSDVLDLINQAGHLLDATHVRATEAEIKAQKIATRAIGELKGLKAQLEAAELRARQVEEQSADTVKNLQKRLGEADAWALRAEKRAQEAQARAELADKRAMVAEEWVSRVRTALCEKFKLEVPLISAATAR